MIKKARLKKGYTQEYVALKLGISLRYYQNIEYNKSIPNVHIAIKLSEILDTDIKIIF